jgi:hypothetical protein
MKLPVLRTEAMVVRVYDVTNYCSSIDIQRLASACVSLLPSRSSMTVG